MAEQLEQTLENLLVPDNDVIQKATLDLKQMLQDPGVIPVLCHLLSTSSKPQVRQYASVLLRRKVLKAKHWNAVSPDVSQGIRQNLLQVLINEPEKSVRKSLTQLVATVAKHEIPLNRWPELFQFLNLYILSNDSNQKEVGMLVLSAMSSFAYEQLKPHMRPLLTLCASALDELQNHTVAHNAILTLMNVLPAIGTEHMKPYQALVPKVMVAIKHLISVDADMAVESLEMLDELASCEVTILSPFVKQVIQFAIEIATNREIDPKVRNKALSFICTIARQKKKTIVKLNLLQPILASIFPIMSDPTAEDEEDEDDDDVSAKSPSAVAAQVIDTMALNFPPIKFISALMKHVEPALQSPDENNRRAAFLALAVSSEGCSDCMRTKYLKKLLQSVYAGMNDPVAEVRGAAMFALGQFSDYLQPDITKYSSELLPLLFDCLAKTSNDCGMKQKDIVRTYYAMEMFCENLGKDILPYLPQLMPFLINAVRTASLEGKELAISAIGATASAAMEDFLPYFLDVINLLKEFLASSDDEKVAKLQTQAIDTFGVLARTVGEHFRPIANDCIELGLNLSTTTTDPDLKRSIYSLFGALSTLLKEEMSPNLGTIVEMMIESLQSTEGLMASYKDSNMAHIQHLFSEAGVEDDEIDITDDSNDLEEEVSELQSLEVQNSYSEEKEDALTALGELAVNTGTAFLPFMDETFKQVLEMVEYPLPDVRKDAILATGQFCCAAFKAATENPSSYSSMTSAMLDSTVPKLVTLIKEESNREVVMAVFDSLNTMLKEIKHPILEHFGSVENIIAIIKDAFQEKLLSQGEVVQEEEEDEDDEQAEYDSLLIETAGELLPTLAELLGGETFAPFFAGLLPDLMKKVKPSSSIPERSFGIGTIAETLHKMGSSSSRFVNPLYNVFMTVVLDDDSEVRSNAVYGMGVLASNGGPTIVPHYNDILKRLLEILNRESDRRTIDNICAAVCRMITSNLPAVPVDQVLPTLVQCLPLQEDKEENITVISCLAGLYSNRQQTLMSLLPNLIPIFGRMLCSDISSEVQSIIVGMVRDVNQNFPIIMSGVFSSAPEEITNPLNKALL